MQVTIRVGLASSGWPDGDPVKSERTEDGQWKHTMSDGREITVPGEPSFRLVYQSSWVGAEPGDTYDVRIALGALSTVREGYFQAWNYDTNKLRNYAFSKTVELVNLTTGESYTADEIREALSRATP